MAIITRTLGVRQVTLLSDTAEKETDKTIFSLRILSAKEATMLQDALSQNKSGSLVYEAVYTALCGWKNLVDATGVEIAFDKKNQKANLDLLGVNVLGELCEHILKLSFPDAEDELSKN